MENSKRQHYQKKLRENTQQLENLLSKITCCRSVIEMAEADILKTLCQEKIIKRKMAELEEEK